MSNLLNLRGAVDLYIGDVHPIALYLGNNKLYHPVPNVLLWLQVVQTSSGDVIKDLSPYNRTVTTQGVVIDISKPKCGSLGSMRFDTANECVLINNNGGVTNSDFETVGLTIEWWEYALTDAKTHRGKWQFNNNNTDTNDATELASALTSNGDSLLSIFSTDTVGVATYAASPIWVHWAITLEAYTYQGNNALIKIFRNGNLMTSQNRIFPTLDNNSNLSIGNIGNNTSKFLNGNIDSFRITKGLRYTSNFTPDEPTTLLNYTSDLR